MIFLTLMASAVSLQNIIKAFRSDTGESVCAIDDVSLEIKDGEFFALLGPSGCGKTTTLRVIAGFEQPDAGRVEIRGKPVQGVPPFHRPVNTVFQDYALFPHMSVLQNVMFSLKMAKVSGPEAKKRAAEALALVQLPNVGARKPSQLSGGQRQRVALARALVNRPEVLLLDEPLGALDLKLRKAMQLELKTLQRDVGITFIFVTHDQEEALTMADRIAVMNAGKVLQVGKPADIYERPQSRFVADFIGETNFIEGKLVEAGQGHGKLKLPSGLELSGVLRTDDLKPGQFASLAVRPEKIRLSSSEAKPAPGYASAQGTLTEAYYLGTDTRYTVQIAPDVSLTVRAQNLDRGFDTMLSAGESVSVSWRTENAVLLT